MLQIGLFNNNSFAHFHGCEYFGTISLKFDAFMVLQVIAHGDTVEYFIIKKYYIKCMTF